MSEQTSEPFENFDLVEHKVYSLIATLQTESVNVRHADIERLNSAVQSLLEANKNSIDGKIDALQASGKLRAHEANLLKKYFSNEITSPELLIGQL